MATALADQIAGTDSIFVFRSMLPIAPITRVSPCTPVPSAAFPPREETQ